MEIREITLTRRRNLGNFEFEEVTLLATLNETDKSPKEALKGLKSIAMKHLGLEAPVAPVKEEEVKDEKPAKKTKKKTTRKKSTKAKPVEQSDSGAEAEASESSKEEVKAEETISLADLKASLAAVWRAKGKPVAVAILEEFGAKRSEELKEEDYAKVMKQCEKALK